MPKQTWTLEEIETLRRMFPDTRISPVEMEKYFRRSWSAIISKAYSLGVRRSDRDFRVWTAEEVAMLTALYPDSRVSPEQMEVYFGRRYQAISQKACHLGLTRSTGGVHAWRDEEIADLKRMYPDLRYTKKQLEEHFSRSCF